MGTLSSCRRRVGPCFSQKSLTSWKRSCIVSSLRRSLALRALRRFSAVGSCPVPTRIRQCTLCTLQHLCNTRCCSCSVQEKAPQYQKQQMLNQASIGSIGLKAICHI